MFAGIPRSFLEKVKGGLWSFPGSCRWEQTTFLIFLGKMIVLTAVFDDRSPHGRERLHAVMGSQVYSKGYDTLDPKLDINPLYYGFIRRNRDTFDRQAPKDFRMGVKKGLLVTQKPFVGVVLEFFQGSEEFSSHTSYFFSCFSLLDFRTSSIV
jgi:hypothetical protein